LWEIVREFQRRGGTVLLTTHYMDEAEKLCDRLAIIDHGLVIAAGTPAGLIAELTGHHVVEFAIQGTRDGDALLKTLPGVQAVQKEDNLYSLQVSEPHLTIPALLAMVQQQGAQLVHLTTRQACLEDVFVKLTGRHLREE
jgi:ABC-2 type transport system ATP-binding protein